MEDITAFWKNKVVWVSGATGAWGRSLCQEILKFPVSRLIAFCRGEHRGFELARILNDPSRLQIFLGDIRDRDAVYYSLHNVDYAIHAAALKRIDAVTFAPQEMVSVNVNGTINVIRGCNACGVNRAFYISSDKAARPTTVYGATKFLAEQLWLAPRPGSWTSFLAARFGNVLWTTGSVLQVWQAEKEKGEPLTIIDPNMTRYIITLPWAVRKLLEEYLPWGVDGELMLPEMSSATIGELAFVFGGPKYPVRVIGMRGMGEKKHEDLDEAGERSSFNAPCLSREELLQMIAEGHAE